MSSTQQALDASQFPVLLQQMQHQLTLVTEKVNKHEGLLQRLAVLEQENKDLKKILQAKDLEIQKLQGQAPGHVPASSTSTKPVSETSHASQAGALSFSTVATAAAHKPTTDATAKKTERKRLAAGRTFTVTNKTVPMLGSFDFSTLLRLGKLFNHNKFYII